MIFKDFLTKLKKDGKITEPEFDGLIENAPEFDIPDKAVQAFEASFLTLDRAAADKAVHGKLRREILDPVDNSLKEILTFVDGIDHFKASEIDKMTSTYDKLKAINAAIPDLYEKAKKAPAADEDVKKKLKTLEDTKVELMDKIEKMNVEFQSKEKFFQSEAEKKINSYRKRIELEKYANSIKFGKAYEEETARKKLTKVTLDELEAKHNLELIDKDGQTFIQVNNKEGQPLYNGNSAVTIQQLLEEEFKPFIKASNAGDDDDDSSQGTFQSQDTKRFKVPDGKQAVRQGARTTVV